MEADPDRNTRDDLLAAAARGHHQATPRLVRDWVEVGLLDRPLRHGLGRGRGVSATWDHNQVHLFLVLLDQRQRGGASISALCNVPVWLWLEWGDAYVPLRQVRRAMATWAAAQERTTWKSSRQVASRVVELLAHPAALRRVRTRLRETLAEAQYDADRVLPDAREALDPARRRQPRGPKGAQLTAEHYGALVEGRRLALDYLGSLPDAVYERARQVFRDAVADYALRQPEFAADPDLGHLFEERDAETRMNAACADLLTVIGLLLGSEAAALQPAQRSQRADNSTNGDG